METNNFDIQKMSREIGIPAVVIGGELGEGKPYLDIFSEALKKYFSAPPGSEAKSSSLKELTELMITPDSARWAYNSAYNDAELKKLALEMWIKLSIIEVNKATTVEEAQKAFFSSPDKTIAQTLGLERWIGLITTIEGALRAYFALPDISDLLMDKLNRIGILEVEKADTKEEVKKIYLSIPYGLDAKVLAIKKLATFYGWKE